MKVCPRCGPQEDSAFSLNRCTATGLQSYCKACRHEIHIERKPIRRIYNVRHNIELHSITMGEFNWLVEKQGGKCAVCGGIYRTGRGGLNIDHFHGCLNIANHRICGRTLYGCRECIRGLVCYGCNRHVLPFLEIHFPDFPYLSQRPLLVTR